ncbi:MAG: hypothetical protein IJ153_00700 [Clostridia bacterium]|nr:hypothetical protein [Clostridia bacterium]
MIEMRGRTSLDQERTEKIIQVLSEEDRYFMHCHHRPPRDRETEDVVDNAYSRLSRIQPLPYTEVDRLYQEMRCQHA